MAELIRSFIAVDVDESLLEKFRTVQAEIMASGADLKPVDFENLHLTLRFLGEIPRPTVEAVIRELAKISFKPFRVKFEGIGAFPNMHRPRVVWVGVSEGAEQLKELASQVESSVGKVGLRPDPKGFTPHLTLARVRSPRSLNRLSEALKRLSSVEVGEMLVDRVRLKRSVLTPKGPVYSNLYEVKAVEQRP